MLSPTSLHRPAMQPTNTAPLFARSSLAYTLRQNARLCLCMLALLQSCSCRGRCTVDQPILIRGPSPLTFWRIAFFSADHHWSSLHVLLLSIPPSLSLPVDSGNSLESAPDACQNMARCRFSSWLVSGGHLSALTLSIAFVFSCDSLPIHIALFLCHTTTSASHRIQCRTLLYFHPTLQPH